MPPVEGKACPLCATVIPATATLCSDCGKEVPIGNYEIVPDGKSFGISLKGRVKIHGLKFKKAQVLVSILNTINGDDEM